MYLSTLLLEFICLPYTNNIRHDLVMIGGIKHQDAHDHVFPHLEKRHQSTIGDLSFGFASFQIFVVCFWICDLHV